MKKIFSTILRGEMTSILILVIILWFIMSFFVDGFATRYNIASLSRTIAITTIVALAQVMVLSVGQFNLALGGMGCCAAIVAAILMQNAGVPVVIAVFVGVLTGSVLGFGQGLLIVSTKINPFIITLSLGSIYLGFVTGITRGEIYNKLPDDFKIINKAEIFGIPVLLLIAIVILIILAFVMYRTYLGRQLLAVGANPRSAEFAGINTKKVILIAHIISGLLAGIAGVLLSTRLGSAQILIGSDWMLVSFAAPVLGGSILAGGKVSVVGTIFGAFFMSMIINGALLINFSYYWFQTLIGLILIVAFTIDRMRLAMFNKQR